MSKEKYFRVPGVIFHDKVKWKSRTQKPFQKDGRIMLNDDDEAA